MRAFLRCPELALLSQSLLQSEENTVVGTIERVLDLLERQCFLLQELFLDDPSMAITGELFEVAEELESRCCHLASYFGRLGDHLSEMRTLQFRLSVVRTAHAHRWNILGPALVDLADSQGRLGNSTEADELYHAVVEELTPILGWGPTFNQDWIVAVQSLRRALERSSRDYGELSGRVRDLLEASEKLLPSELTARER